VPAGVLAGTWLSVALVMRQAPPGAASDALGLLLLIAAVAMLVPAVTAIGGKLLTTAVLATTSLRFAATGLYELSASNPWRQTAGVIGVVLGVLAVYAALAMALENAGHRTVLPVLRRGAGRRSLEGGLGSLAEDGRVVLGPELHEP